MKTINKVLVSGVLGTMLATAIAGGHRLCSSKTATGKSPLSILSDPREYDLNQDGEVTYNEAVIAGKLHEQRRQLNALIKRFR